MPEAPVYDHPDTARLIETALREDLRFGDDLTCRALVPASARLSGLIRAKAPGVVCGLPVFARVCATLGSGVEVREVAADGTAVQPGDVVLRFQGPAAILLKAERTALNICQRLSGTASLTRRFVEAIAGTRARILDTRKTTPGLRLLEKHAVAMGGGTNHRMGLYDAVLIKENHIALMGAVGGPAEAVRRTRAALGAQVLVQVEVEHLVDLEPCIAAGADMVLLDNMQPHQIHQAVAIRDRVTPAGRTVLLEASGGITLETVRGFAETGVDRISTGALTHSVPALDLSMRCDVVAG